MKYIVDSSLAFKWLVPEIDTDKAIRVRDDYRHGIHQLLAPDIFPTELAHALTRAERTGRIAFHESLQLLADALKLLPVLRDSLPVLPRAVEISSQTRVGVYDCLYVALSEQEQCDLLTADDRLVAALQNRFPQIVALSSLP